ncbi:hypothetical protein Q0Z83_098870 [Actinoplanes sichuanensis]|uniref:Uncharacterized protein n=1 Tax=Actinoplanes sichuanensis TaxID=512349 RepID=A0ABW4AG97_9ACTN|nr:hypothetical protein [Actinoplanes sichuanensis]BEL11696.1 hypothetical protein Q0Z83_098870 [Actinoplanes sichuanensis]
MRESELAERLGKAGLVFIGWPDEAVPRVPVAVARYAVSAGSDTGRDEVSLRYTDPGWQSGGNDAWFTLASDAGLFGAGGEFLVAVALEPDVWPVRSRWAGVRLAASWDIVGEGAADLLGSGRHHPEFVMLSPDGEVIVQGTVRQDGISFLAVHHPRDSGVLRKQGEFFANWHRAHPEDRQAARSWLDADAG